MLFKVMHDFFCIILLLVSFVIPLQAEEYKQIEKKIIDISLISPDQQQKALNNCYKSDFHLNKMLGYFSAKELSLGKLNQESQSVLCNVITPLFLAEKLLQLSGDQPSFHALSYNVFKQALTLYQSALKELSFIQGSYPQLLFYINRSLAKLYKEQLFFSEAELFYTQALKTANESPALINRLDALAVMEELLSVYRQLNLNKPSNNLKQEIVKGYKTLLKGFDKVLVLSKLADFYSEINETEKAIDSYKKLFKMPEKNNFDLTYAYVDLALLYEDQSKFPQAIATYKTMLKYQFDKTMYAEFQPELNKLFNPIGLDFDISEWVQSLYQVSTGKQLASLNDQFKLLTFHLNNVALVYSNQYKEKNEIVFLQRIWQINKSLPINNLFVPEVDATVDRLIYYYREKQPHLLTNLVVEASTLFKDALHYMEKDREHYFYSIKALIRLYMLQNQFKQITSLLNNLLVRPDGESLYIAIMSDIHFSHSIAKKDRQVLMDKAFFLVKKNFGSNSTQMLDLLEKQVNYFYGHAEVESWLIQRLNILLTRCESNLQCQYNALFEELTELQHFFVKNNRADELLPLIKQVVVHLQVLSLKQKGIIEIPGRKKLLEFLLLILVEYESKSTESLTVLQLLSQTDDDALMTQIALRFAENDKKVSNTVRLLQDYKKHQQFLKGLLSKKTLSFRLHGNSDQELAFKQEIGRLSVSINKLALELQQQIPNIDKLVNMQILPLLELQRNLKKDETLLAYKVFNHALCIWVITHDDYDVQLVPDYGRSQLATDIATLRVGLDQTDISSFEDIKDFDFKLSYELYSKLIKPVAGLLKEDMTIFVVPDAGLVSLPFGVLVRNLRSTNNQEADWLIKSFAFDSLPTINSLAILKNMTASKGAMNFLGFGHPKFTKNESVDTSFVNNLKEWFLRYKTQGGGKVDSSLNQLPDLPDTKQQLDGLRKLFDSLFGSDNSVTYMQEAATESKIKRLNRSGTGSLRTYKTLAFATHGLLAGEFSDEAALVLTPPAENDANSFDDGLLTASEIAMLNLNADWVVLSACNTGTVDKSGSGLSGLVKSFFYAGARSLFVTHWSVNSRSTTVLLDKMANVLSIRGTNKAQALRKAKQSLIMNEGNSYEDFSHPYFWAPYFLIGKL